MASTAPSALEKTVAAALIRGSFVSTASATDCGVKVKPVKQYSRKTAATGALLGPSGALIGAAIVSNQARDLLEAGYGHQQPVHFVEAEEDCFEKPIKRFDRYSGETIIVGYKTICR